MNEPLISAVIMARNEEANIADAVASVWFAAQIVVADTGSGDSTIDIARKAGAEVHSIPFDGFGTSKNRALEFCRCEWILSLDADERVSPELAKNISEQLSEPSDYDGFAFSRLTYFLGKPVWHSGWQPDYILRLFRQGKGRFSDRLVHEGVLVNGRAGRLDGLLYHYSYPTLEKYFEKMKVYSSLNAQELLNSGRRFHWFDPLIHPPATFFKMYILKLGFLDGVNGLLLAGLSSFHIVKKYLKLRELCQRD
jgi:glycosyltransferase involved in cell wall biosynthesis